MKKTFNIFAVMIILFIISSKVWAQNSDNPRQIEGVFVDVKVYLAGYMSEDNSDTKMSTFHLDADILPLTPLNREGGMGLNYPHQRKWLNDRNPVVVSDSILKMNKISSYVQVELRKNMTFSKVRYFKYGLVTSTGQVMDVTGSSKIRFTQIPAGQYYLIIHQANHLSVGSKNKFDISFSPYITYDFTTGLDKYFSEYLGGRRLDNDPAVEIRPGIWALWGGDCSGSGNQSAEGGDDYNDFSDLAYIQNKMSDTSIYDRGDIDEDTKITQSDVAKFNSWSFKGSYIPFIEPMNIPMENGMMFVLNPAIRYRLTAEQFKTAGDTLSFKINILSTGEDTIFFRWAQLFLKLNYSSTDVDTVLLECPITNSGISLSSQGVIQAGMMSNDPIIISKTVPYTMGTIRIIYKPGTIPQIHGLLSWTTSGLRTKIFSQIDNQLVDITNPDFHYINDSIVLGVSNILESKMNYKLSQNYPNPFNPTTKIDFSVPIAGMVRLSIFDISGKQVATLVNERKNAGSYFIEFDGSKLSSGTYFYKLEAGGIIETRKMILLK